MSGIILAHTNNYSGSMKSMGRKTFKDMGSNFHTIVEYDCIKDLGFPIFSSEHFFVLFSGMPILPNGKNYFSMFKELFKKERKIRNAMDEIKTWEGSFSFIIIDRLERDIYAITDRLGSEELYFGNKMICNSSSEFTSLGYEEVQHMPQENQYYKLKKGHLFLTNYQMDIMRETAIKYPQIEDLSQVEMNSKIEGAVKAAVLTAVGKKGTVKILKENSDLLIKILKKLNRPYDFFENTDREGILNSLIVLNGAIDLEFPKVSTIEDNVYYLDVFRSGLIQSNSINTYIKEIF